MDVVDGDDRPMKLWRCKVIGERRAGDPGYLEVDGVVGEERLEVRKLLDCELAMKEHWVGLDSLPESLCGWSVELKIRATDVELGDETG